MVVASIVRKSVSVELEASVTGQRYGAMEAGPRGRRGAARAAEMRANTKRWAQASMLETNGNGLKTNERLGGRGDWAKRGCNGVGSRAEALRAFR